VAYAIGNCCKYRSKNRNPRTLNFWVAGLHPTTQKLRVLGFLFRM
jgi:hypothetical protein